MNQLVDIYARLSLNRDGKSHSVENQVAACRKYAKERGWTVGKVYKDDSYSATTGKTRPAFEALLARTEQRPVVVWNTDRLARMPRDLERVLDTKMTVNALQLGTLDLSTPGGKRNARVNVAVAAGEIEERSERQRLSNDRRAADGEPYWRIAPLGHHLDGSVNEPEKDLIRAAVDELLEGKTTLYGIAQDWNAQGVRTSKRKSGGHWRPSAVREMLSNPRMAGRLVYKGERMPNSKIQPILDGDTYDALRGTFSDPKRRTGAKAGGPVANLLTGVALCGICGDGTTMHATSVEHKGRTHELYRCSRRSHCRHYREETDSIVTGEVFRVLTNEPEVVLSGEVDVRVEAEVMRLRDELSEWEAAADAGDITVSEYLRVTKSRRAALERAESARQAANQVELFRGLITEDMSVGQHLGALIEHVSPWWDDLTLERQRAVVANLFEVTLLPRTNQTSKYCEDRVQVVRR